MRQPEITRHTILHRASRLFNTKGYKATSISDVTDATQLTKGAIYRHFQNKEELEIESFDYMLNEIKGLLRAKVKKENNAIDKLKAVLSFFQDYIKCPPIEGGCPLLNASTEVDDSSSPLKSKAIEMYTTLKDTLIHIIDKGKINDQIKSEINSEAYASVIICSLEGAIMTGRLSKSTRDMRNVISFLSDLIENMKKS